MPLQLQQAFDEIAAIVKKHDLAGVIVLASPTHTEYQQHLSPSWSCARLGDFEEGKGWELRIRAKRKDFPSREAHEKCVTETTGMVAGFADVLRVTAENMSHVLAMLGQHFNIDHRSTRDPRGDRP